MAAPVANERSLMGKGNRSRAQHRAVEWARRQVEYSEGQLAGEIEAGGPDEPAPVRELIRRYNEAVREGLRACPHLQRNRDLAALWVVPVPDLLACEQCAPVLRDEIIRRELRQARCLMCGEPAAVKNFSAAVGGVVLRGGVCEQCTPAEWQDRV
jgi:hypothetical protein